MSESTTWHKCAWHECENQVAHHPSDRRKREYCSNSCKQKAYRHRQREAVEHNGEFVTFWDQAIDALAHLDTTQKHKLQSLLDDQLGTHKLIPDQAPPTSLTVDDLQMMGDTIAYYRLRRGVIHLGFSDQPITLCFREKEKMSESQALPLGAKVCRRCQENSNAEWVKIGVENRT